MTESTKNNPLTDEDIARWEKIMKLAREKKARDEEKSRPRGFITRKDSVHHATRLLETWSENGAYATIIRDRDYTRLIHAIARALYAAARDDKVTLDGL